MACNEDEPPPPEECFPNVSSLDSGNGIFNYEGDQVVSISSDEIFNPWFDGFWPEIMICNEIPEDFERTPLEIYEFDVLRSYNCADSCVYISNIKSAFCEVPFELNLDEEYTLTKDTFDLGFLYSEGTYFHPPCEYYDEIFDFRGFGVYDRFSDRFRWFGPMARFDCGSLNMSFVADTINHIIQLGGLSGIQCASPYLSQNYKLNIEKVMNPDIMFAGDLGDPYTSVIEGNRMIWYNEDSTRWLVWYAREGQF